MFNIMLKDSNIQIDNSRIKIGIYGKSNKNFKSNNLVDDFSFKDKSKDENLNDSNKQVLIKPPKSNDDFNSIIVNKNKLSSVPCSKFIRSTGKVKENLLFHLNQDKQEDKNDVSKNFLVFKQDCNKFLDMIYNNNDFYRDYNGNGFENKINERKKRKLATKLFKNFMDYGMIFNCIKELKILELILLNETSADFFYKVKDKNYDINKLMLVLEDEKLREKLCSSIKNKDYVLKQCIV